MKRTVKGSVVVITGASSGIGAAAAYAFADEGAKLVLAARDEQALEEVARACRGKGTEAIVVPTDVTDESQVFALRLAAVAAFGRIDTWVNDAAVYMMGTVECTPSAAVKQLFDTNVMGVVHGMRAAMTAFRAQGDGVLINIGSVAGKVPYAYASAYCASKHAVHALTEALRQELVGTAIEACVVAPATVDTPLFQHAANYTGHEIKAMNPIYRPEQVAEAIVSCAARPRREVLVGAMPRTMTMMQMLMPGLWERMMPKMVERDHMKPDTSTTPWRGNMKVSLGPHQMRGGWKQPRNLKIGAILAAVAAAIPLVFAARAVAMR